MKLRAAKALQGLGFVLAALWLGLGLVIWGAFQVGPEIRFAAILSAAGWILVLAAVAFTILGLALFVAALRTHWAAWSKRVPSQTLTYKSRLALTSLFGGITLLVVAAGTINALVWNLEAKVPELSRDQVVAAMEAAGEYPGAGGVAVWAIFWAALAVSFVVFSALGGLDRLRTMKQVVVTGLTILAVVPFFYWIAVFPLGMGVADTFGLSGADAAPAGFFIAMIGLLSGAGAFVVGLTQTVEGKIFGSAPTLD